MRPALLIDWPKILDDIAYLAGEPVPTNPVTRVPLGQRLLAQHLGCERGLVRGWIEGKAVEYHHGVMLLEHWMRATGKDAAFAPRTRPTFSASDMQRV